MTNSMNPYVGLRPFEMDESILFFGRNEQTLQMLQRLHQHHFVSVVGSSGCGKSSLLRAGLIPALKAGYLVEDSDHWFIAIMKPGQNPLYNLAESLLKQVNNNSSEQDVIAFVQKINEEGADVVIDLLAPLEKEKNLNFFLLVDQFEELFRFAMDQKDAARKDEAIDFVNIILELSNQRTIPFYVVLTMRSDFIGDCAHFYGLPEAMNKSQYLVPRLNRAELKMVIEGPAKLYGGKFTPSLTSKLINELSKVKDELPLLQHTLMRMWDYENLKDKNGEVDLADYEKIGGIDKALSKHADEALIGLSENDQAIAKKMFQSLTAIDENGRKIRRPVLLSQLKELTGASEEKLLGIIDLFIKDSRSFLIVNKTIGNDKLIDISHESLIRQWDTLGKWVDEEGESAGNYLRLLSASELHEKNKKDFLFGSELQIALEWYNKIRPTPTWANRYKEGFSKAEKYLLDSESDEKAEQEAEKARIKREVAGKRRQRLLIMGIGLLLLIAAATSMMIVASTRKSRTITKQNQLIRSAFDSATIAKDEATLQKIIADSNAKVAKKNADFAQQRRLEADIQRVKAIEEQKKATVERKNAEVAKKLAEKTSAQLAIKNQELAIRDSMTSMQARISLENKNQLLRKTNAELKYISLFLGTRDSSTPQTLVRVRRSLDRVQKSLAIAIDSLFKILPGFNKENTQINAEEDGLYLEKDQGIISKNGKYLLAYQSTGEMILYRREGMVPLWSTPTFGYPAWRVYMQNDGNLVIYTAKPSGPGDNAVWASNTNGHRGAKLTVEDDGNLIIRDVRNNIIWQSFSRDTTSQ